MRLGLLLFLLVFLAADAVAQPNTLELGYQTTKRGITWYRNAPPTHVPAWRLSRDTNAVSWVDMTSGLQYDWEYAASVWRTKGVVSTTLPPLPTQASGAATISNTHATWRNAAGQSHRYETAESAWVPIGKFIFQSAAPVNVAAGGSNGAALRTTSLWQDSDDRELYYHDGAAWVPMSRGRGIYGVSDTTQPAHLLRIAAASTLTFQSLGDNFGGVVPFRVKSDGTEPDIMGMYANGDSLVFGKADTEIRVGSSTGLSIAAANVLALQGDSVQVQTLPTAPSTEKTYVVQGPDAYLRTREGVPLSHLTQSGATTGQVPKWDGSAWVPGSDTGDNWGSQSVTTTGTTLSGNGTSGSPLFVPTGGITATEILDGTIANADVATAANIANSKLANSGVTAGTYPGTGGVFPQFTVNSKGILTNVINVPLPDASPSNEGTLGVGAGGPNDAQLTSNTSGATGVTYAGGTAIGISETTNTNGGTITITNTGDTDGTNDLTISDTVRTVTGASTHSKYPTAAAVYNAIAAVGSGRPDSTFALAPGGGYAGKRITSNVYRTGKMSLHTTDTTGQLTIGRDSASATPAIVARYGDASNGAFNFFSLQPISQTGNGGGLLGNFNFWATNFTGANVPYSSRANHVWRFGYNTAGGGGRIISTDADLHIAFESMFHNTSLDGIVRRDWEWHLQSQDTVGGVHRMISAKGAHNGRSGDIGFNSDGLYLSRYNTGASWLTANRFAKTWAFQDSMAVLFDKNGVGAGGIFQRNAANSAYLNLMYADASDRIVNGGTGVTSVYMPAGKLDIAGAGEVFNTSGNLLTVGTSGAPTTLRVNANGNEAITLKSTIGGSNAWTTYINASSRVEALPSGSAYAEIYTNAPYTLWANNRLGLGPTVGSRFHVTQIGNGAEGGIGLENLSGVVSYLQTNGIGHFSFINASGTERWSVAQNGQMNLGAYTSTSSFPVTAAGALVFNSSGNIGTSAFDSNPSDDVTGSGVSGRATFWNGTQTVTSDADWTFDGLNQNLGGSLIANGQSTNLARFGSIAAAPEYPGIWFGDATPSFSNYAVLWDNGAQALALNAPPGAYLTGKINNSEIWRTNATGLGIGNISPSQKLHVSGNARVTGAYYDSNNDPGSAGQVMSSTVTGTDWVAASTLGDNWGSQTVTTTGTTLSGNGTSGSPLKVASDGIGPTELAPTAVTPGSYVTTNVTVDADGRITAASSGSVAYQTFRDDGAGMTQRGNANFVSTSTVSAALTDDGANNETEVRMTVPTDGITATEIAANAVGASELASLGTAGTYGSGTQVPVITTDPDGRVSAVTNTTITGTLSGLTATRIPFASAANALTDDANLTWNNTTKRLSVGNTGGSPSASVHIAEGSVAAWEPLKAVGTVSGNMITTLSNAQNSGGASNSILDNSVGGANAGDPMYRLIINGVDTWSIGVDNSDADKLKIGRGTTPSTMSNVGITMTADATPLVGINNDAPLHPLHVIGRATATVLQGISGTPTHTFGTGAGTGPTLGNITGCSNGINIQFTLGTSPTVGGNIVSISLPTSFSNLSFPTYSCGNDRTATEDAAGKFVISAASATAFTVKHNAEAPALTAGDTLFFRFNISGR